MKPRVLIYISLIRILLKIIVFYSVSWGILIIPTSIKVCRLFKRIKIIDNQIDMNSIFELLKLLKKSIIILQN